MSPQPPAQCTASNQISSNYAQSHGSRKHDKGKGTYLQKGSSQIIRQQSGQQDSEGKSLPNGTSLNSLTGSQSRNTHQGKVQSGPREGQESASTCSEKQKGSRFWRELKHQFQVGLESSLDANLGSTAWFSQQDYFEGGPGSKCMLLSHLTICWLHWGYRWGGGCGKILWNILSFQPRAGLSENTDNCLGFTQMSLSSSLD